MKWKSWKFGSNARRLPVIADLRAWTKSQGIAVREIYPSVLARRHPSRSIPETLKSILDRPTDFLVQQRREWDLTKYSRLYSGETYEVPATCELDLTDCWVHLPSGTVITPEQEVLINSTLAPKCFYEGHSEVSWEEAPWIEEDAFLLATVWGRNYAHWLFDALPRASSLHSCPERTVLLDRGAPNFQGESIQLAWPESSILIPQASLVRCRNLRLHLASARSGVPNPAALGSIRERLITASEGRSKDGPRRLYISRQSTRRRILNHDALMPVLKNYGFEEIICEQLSFAQQVKLFAGCEAILGAHGAGTLNALFAPQNARLIELFNPRVWDHGAHRVANLCGISHWHLFAENANKEFDIRVDPRALDKLLDLALSDGQPSRGEEIF